MAGQSAAEINTLRASAHIRARSAVHTSELITPAPVSYKDVVDPKHGNKLGIIDIQYQYTMVCAALAARVARSMISSGKKTAAGMKNAACGSIRTNERRARAEVGRIRHRRV